MKQDIRLLKEHADTTLQSLEVIAQTFSTIAANQQRFDQMLERLAEAQFRTDEKLLRTDEKLDRLIEAQARADERQARTEEAVQRLSDTVDRYLNARLNGNQQN